MTKMQKRELAQDALWVLLLLAMSLPLLIVAAYVVTR